MTLCPLVPLSGGAKATIEWLVCHVYADKTMIALLIWWTVRAISDTLPDKYGRVTRVFYMAKEHACHVYPLSILRLNKYCRI